MKSRSSGVLIMGYHGILVLVCLLLPLLAQAERVDPFLVTVKVSDRSATARQPAMRQALGEVLVGLSGQALLVRDLNSQSRLVFRDQLVQQFRYLESSQVEGGPPDMWLEVRFNPVQVRELAVQLGLPEWPLERGVTLLWVALDNGVSRELLGADAAHQPISDAAMLLAAQRKLPLLMPLLDLEDLRQVSFSDVWGGFADQVAMASKRYAVQYLVFGRVYRTASGWGGNWQVRDGKEGDRWSVQGSDESAVISAAIEHAAEWLGQRYSVLGAGQSDQILRMRLDGIQEIGDYSRVLRYLSGLSVIQRVAPLVVTADTLVVSIQSTAGLEAIQQALAIEAVLAPVEFDLQTGASNPALHYRLNPQ